MTQSILRPQFNFPVSECSVWKWLILRVVFTIYIAGISSIAFSQTITITELEKICTYSNVNFAGFMGGKGFFSLSSSSDDEWTWWKATVKNNKTEIQEMVDKGQKKSLPTITYSLASKSAYQKLKLSITNSGYAFHKNMVASDGTPMEIFFNRKGFLIQFFSITVDNQVFYATYLKKTPPYEGDD